MTYYSRELKMPNSKLEGLCNFVQMIINKIEAGQTEEALLTAVDLLDTLSGQANPFASITSEKDNAMLAELKHQHTAEMLDAITRSHAEGFAQGEQAQKRKLAEMLGLAA
jgi:hypothetical protein